MRTTRSLLRFSLLVSALLPACGRGTAASGQAASTPATVTSTQPPSGGLPPTAANPNAANAGPSMPTGITNQAPPAGMPPEHLPPSMPVPNPNAANPNTSNPSPTAPPLSARWLHTQANHIVRADNSPWMGRGVNLFDTRGCGACLYDAPNPAEVMRRADYVVNSWRGNLIRLDLESYAAAAGRVQWGGVLVDANYVRDIKSIVDHMTANPNTYVLLTLLVDPTFNDNWVPTPATLPEWSQWASVFANNPQVMFGICNEPHDLADSDNPSTWAAMNASVQAIRAVEDAAQVNHHLVAVQGTNGWARDLSYYVTHPIASDNVIYEVHPYAPSSSFDSMIWQPAATLPVIVGEFGYWPGAMSYADCMRLMAGGDALGVPYISWSFHWNCGIALLENTATDSCGINLPFQPTPWGAVNSAHMRAMNGAQTGTDPTVGHVHAVQDANYCLAVRGAQTADGTALELQPCVSAPEQMFAWSGNSLRALGLCVDDSGGVQDNGTPLQMWSCGAGNANQQWQLDGGQLTLQGTAKCIDISAFIVAPGVRLQLWDCLAGINQLWQLFAD